MMTELCSACNGDMRDGKGHGIGLCDANVPTNAALDALMAGVQRDAEALSSAPRSIACEDVREGDFIYDSPTGRRGCTTGSWMRVRAVDPPDGKDNVWIHGTRWSTCGHRRQGIAVKRARWE